MYIDSHAHFDMILSESSVSEADLLMSTAEKDVVAAVQISIDLPSLEWSRAFIKRNNDGRFSFTAGIHPSSAADEVILCDFRKTLEEILNSVERGFLLGIGECGLDYYRMRQPKETQRRSFEFQLDLARTHRLPVIIHTRDAIDDTLSILKGSGNDCGIIHCFPGDRETAKKFLDCGFYLSFAGNVTYNKATDMQEAASFVPLERMLIETDAPFLTPVPLRGKKNRPEYIGHTYAFLASLKNLPLDEIKESVGNNFRKLRTVNRYYEKGRSVDEK